MNSQDKNNNSGIKVLIIDDDELVRMTFKSIISRAGYTIFEADNGSKGLDLFKKEKPQVVVTDILMPDKEGLETITEMREFNSDAKIIAISGGGSTNNMSFLQLAKEVGADHTLSKPIRPSALLTAIEALLQK